MGSQSLRWGIGCILFFIIAIFVLIPSGKGQSVLEGRLPVKPPATSPTTTLDDLTDLYSVDVDHQAILHVFVSVMGEYGLRIGFEDIGYTAKDYVKLGDAISALQAAATTRPLSPQEAQQLARAKDFLTHGMDPQKTNFDIADFKLNGHYNGSTPAKLFDSLTIATPFKWSETNGTYLIEPAQGSILTFPVTLAIQTDTIENVIDAILKQQPSGSKLHRNRGYSGGGPGPPSSGGAPAFWKSPVKNLNFDKLAADIALCRACEAANPPLSWVLEGMDARGNGRPLDLYK